MAMTGDQRLGSRAHRIAGGRDRPSTRGLRGLTRHVVPWEVVKAEALDRVSRTRLARECAKLDPRAEREFADEGLARDLEEWPEY